MAERIFRGQMEFDIVGVNEHEAVGEMEVTEAILNGFGTIQAGALVWFADVVAMSLVLGDEQPQEGRDNFPVAVTLNAQLLGSCRDGHLVARARWMMQEGDVLAVRTKVRDAEGRVLLDLTSTLVGAH
ncbi:PaaI family thioesterase [Paracoccus gahaiensis]|uniref:PaaI family thioesterase n=2 Tax=Paracoccus TaxID=265 RepID=A0A4P7HM90_9RHOB|nr:MULTISPECIES: PaaI family thioesterase [Paracoccus]QBX35316.1 PaaI family thioesterase [Paracoccus liaowanqingii]TGN60440.1 PaaI family thioesterase [Paracoccus liaowanqingii]TJZ89568.1 PaaI family thioesterase [Paracoccus gahaiensis]